MSSRADSDITSMQFIETASYQRPLPSNSSGLEVPVGWGQYKHPNDDIYYYHPELRLITPEDIRDPVMLQFVLDARLDHLQCLQADDSLSKLADDWELTLTDVTDAAAVIGMFSRNLGVAYEWSEGKGLELKTPEYFWSHVAEYPSHHAELPPNAESEFSKALTNARTSVDQGVVFPFSKEQIEHISKQYDHFKELQAQGRNVTPSIGWLIGATMPLENSSDGIPLSGHPDIRKLF